MKIAHSVQFRSFSINPKLNILHIWNLHDETITSVGGPSPAVAGRALMRRHAPPRALKTTARDGHAPDLIQRIADVMMTLA